MPTLIHGGALAIGDWAYAGAKRSKVRATNRKTSRAGRVPYLMVSALLFLYVFSNGVATAQLSPWAWRNPLPEGRILYGAAYGNNRFVAVGSGGTVLVSAQGTNWSLVKSGTDAYLLDVTFGGNQFVAVANSGSILTSTDATNWTPRASGTDLSLSSVAYGSNVFVAVEGGWINRGGVAYSSDATTWSITRTNLSFSYYDNHPLNGVTYGNGLFVAVGVHSVQDQAGFWSSKPEVALSADGRAWTNRTFDQPCDNLVSVGYGKNLFVALGSTTNGTLILTSPDGTVWTVQTLVSPLYRVFYAGDQFLAVGYGTALVSPDGTNWTTGTLLPDNASLYGLAYGDGQTVAVGGGVFTSTNSGSNWTDSSSGPHYALRSVAYGNNLFVAAGSKKRYWSDFWNENAAIVTSPDGVTWTDQTPQLDEQGTSRQIASVAHGSDPWSGEPRFVAVGGDAIVSLTDGGYWTNQTSGFIGGINLQGVAFGNGQFVAVGAVGKGGSPMGGAYPYGRVILSSIDGISWSVDTQSMMDDPLLHVAYAGGLFVAWGGSAILVSNDGVNWATTNWPPYVVVSSVAYGNNRFVAVGWTEPGADSLVLTSSDGTNWISRDTAIDYGPITAITYAYNQFVSVTEFGTVIYSEDGIHWSEPVNIADGSLAAITYGNGGFVAAGDYGSILQASILPKLGPIVHSRTTAQFAVAGPPDKEYIIQASTDLKHWIRVGSCYGDSGGFTDQYVRNIPKRFYRALVP